MENCIACELLTGKKHLPGGAIHQNKYWSLEPCIGPFYSGTIILKPIRHVLSFSDLTDIEAKQFGILLKESIRIIKSITKCDQVYICQWSHAGWTPVHIHFVLQPVWNEQREKYTKPGAFLQAELSSKYEFPSEEEIEEFVSKAKEEFNEHIFEIT